jgi:hypothetical protein
MWTGFILIRTGTSKAFLWTRQWNFGFHRQWRYRIWGSRGGGCGELHFLVYRVVQSVESQQQTFRRHMSPTSSGTKNKISRKLAWKQVASRDALHVPPKRRLTLNGLHGIISQKTELFNGNVFDCLRYHYIPRKNSNQWSSFIASRVFHWIK